MAIVPQQRRNQTQNGESKCKLKIISNEKNSITIFPKDSKKQSKNKARLLHPVIELDDSGLRITNRF